MKYLILGLLLLIDQYSHAKPESIYRTAEEAQCDKFYNDSQYSMAIKTCEESANNNSALSMTNLAWLIKDSDIKRSMDLLQKASQLGNARAMLNLGINLVQGLNGVEVDKNKGIYWLKESEKHGNIQANVEIGKVFLSDRENILNKLEVKKSLIQAVKSGSGAAYSMYSDYLFDHYEYKGNYWQNSDVSEAYNLKAMKRANEGRNCNDLLAESFKYCNAFLYDTDRKWLNKIIDIIEGHKINEIETYELQKEINKFNEIKAVFPENIRHNLKLYVDRSYAPKTIKTRYLNTYDFINDGSKIINNKDIEDDVLLAQKVAEMFDNRQLDLLSTENKKSIAKAYFKMGVFHLSEQKDSQKSNEYFNKAASLGSIEAHERLGVLYQSGSIGSKNIKKAIEHYEKAVTLRNDPHSGHIAEFELSKIYAKGVGVNADGLRAAQLLKAFVNTNNYIVNSVSHFADHQKVEINGTEDKCPIIKEQNISCTQFTSIDLLTTHLLLSGDWGKKFQKYGEQKLNNLIKLQKQEKINNYQDKLVTATKIMLKNKPSSSFYNDPNLNEISNYLGELPYIKHKPLNDDHLNKAEWIKLRNKYNKLGKKLWPNAHNLIEEINYYETNELVNKQFNKKGKWRLPMKVLVVLKPKQSETSYVIYSNENITAANKYLETCNIILEPAEVLSIRAEFLGRIDSGEWNVEDFDKRPIAKGENIDWRWDVPRSNNPVMVFFEHIGHVESMGLIERGNKNIDGAVAFLDDTNDRYYYGSKLPVLIYGDRLEYDYANLVSPITISHEIGHLLGLPHSRHFQPSIMSYVYLNSNLPVLFGEKGMVFSDEECKQMQKSPYLEKIN